MGKAMIPSLWRETQDWALWDVLQRCAHYCWLYWGMVRSFARLVLSLHPINSVSALNPSHPFLLAALGLHGNLLGAQL